MGGESDQRKSMGFPAQQLSEASDNRGSNCEFRICIIFLNNCLWHLYTSCWWTPAHLLQLPPKQLKESRIFFFNLNIFNLAGGKQVAVSQFHTLSASAAKFLDVCSADDIWSELTLNNDAPIKVAIRKPCWSWQNISSQKSGQKCCLQSFSLLVNTGWSLSKSKEELILLIGRLFPVVRPDMSYKMKSSEGKIKCIWFVPLSCHLRVIK